MGKGAIIGMQWEEVSPFLIRALLHEQDYEKRETGVVAQGIVRSAQLLSIKYNWVITNVPYLGRGKQNEVMSEYCEKYYPDAKNDLVTVFLERNLLLCEQGGTSRIVLPQNWLFLSSYSRLRRELLTKNTWNLIARLGEGGFDSSSCCRCFHNSLSY